MRKEFMVMVRNGENHFFFKTNKENVINDAINAMNDGEVNDAEITVFTRTSKMGYEKVCHKTKFQVGFHK